MKITLAQSAGFCFGVKRATDTLESLIAEKKGRIYTYGDIIHNPQYLEQMRKRGVTTVGEADIPRLAAEASPDSPVYVLIRAHGIMKHEEELLRKCEAENPDFHAVDCTCPFVSKVHRIADEETDANAVFILIGSREHPEVKGIVSWARGEAHAFASADEVESHIMTVGAGKWQNRK